METEKMLKLSFSKIMLEDTELSQLDEQKAYELKRIACIRFRIVGGDVDLTTETDRVNYIDGNAKFPDDMNALISEVSYLEGIKVEIATLRKVALSQMADDSNMGTVDQITVDLRELLSPEPTTFVVVPLCETRNLKLIGKLSELIEEDGDGGENHIPGQATSTSTTTAAATKEEEVVNGESESKSADQTEEENQEPKYEALDAEMEQQQSQPEPETEFRTEEEQGGEEMEATMENQSENQNENTVDSPSRPISSPSPSSNQRNDSSSSNNNNNMYSLTVGSGTKATKSIQQAVSEGLWPSYCNPAYVMPESIEVKVSLPAGDYFFPVKIVKNSQEKIYLGGYRNKLTGALYHHAATQTPTDTSKSSTDANNLRTRETQTTATRTLSLQTIREAGTQMEREDLRINTKRDVVKVSRRYVTADQVMTQKKVKAIIVQRYWRGHLARQRANGIRQRNVERDRLITKAKEEEIHKQNQQRDENMRRRLQPKTNADFEILYNELDAWRRAEITKIKFSDKSSEDKQLAFAALLQEETNALQSIERLKMAAHREIQNEKNEKMLELMSKPRQWQLSSGEVALVQTPETIRAKELLELYRAVISPVSTVQSRLEILLQVKWTVQVYNDKLSSDITELIDREADLLNRGRPFKAMEKLRIRIAHLFLEFIECPDFNPRAAEFVNISVTVNR